MQYKIIFNRLAECPSFLYPIRFGEEPLTLISEIQEENCLGFSNLEDQDNKSLIILRMFDEIAEEKNIVPVRADILNQKILKKEAELLINSFIDSYLDTEFYNNYVEVFSKDFLNFDYQGFLKTYSKEN